MARRITVTNAAGDAVDVQLLTRDYFEAQRCNKPGCACGGANAEGISVSCGQCERGETVRPIWFQSQGIVVLQCAGCDCAIGALRVTADT